MPRRQLADGRLAQRFVSGLCVYDNLCADLAVVVDPLC